MLYFDVFSGRQLANKGICAIAWRGIWAKAAHMYRLLLLIITFASSFAAQAQELRWLPETIEQTQTLSFDLEFGSEITLVSQMQAADLEVRALATHSIELIDGTIMAAILRTQPEVTLVNGPGEAISWATNTRAFEEIGAIDAGLFSLTIAMPAIEGANFVPNVKLELILSPITPETDSSFADRAVLLEGVRGADTYGLRDLQGATVYPNVDMSERVVLRDLESLSMAAQGGLCGEAGLVRSLYATVNDLGAEITDLAQFPQACWRTTESALTPGDIAENAGYQPDIRVRLRENRGEVVGFVYGAGSAEQQIIFVQNTSRGWLYGDGIGEWTRISNGGRTDVPFGDGVLAIRNPRGGETTDATENDAFVSYLSN